MLLFRSFGVLSLSGLRFHFPAVSPLSAFAESLSEGPTNSRHLFSHRYFALVFLMVVYLSCIPLSSIHQQ
jgi:hypothetical protein